MNNEVYSEKYKGLTINIMLDDSRENPFEAWDCEPPIAVYAHYNRGINEYSTQYGNVNNVPTLTREQIKANLPAILELCDASNLWDLTDERREYNTLKGCINHVIERNVECLGDSDRLDALCDLYNMAGMPAVCDDVRGCSQSDWAKVLAVATPEFREECGNGESFDWITSLKASIQLFEDWAFGNVYGYEVLDAEGEDVSSCWGFFGDYDADYGALSEAKSAADYHAESLRKSHFEQVKTWIRNRVPLGYRTA
jgi:hypothetical protein